MSRYTVKYVCKVDEGNRVTLKASVHSGSEMDADEIFLHNTKITCLRINEDEALNKSKSRKHPLRRAIVYPDKLGRVLGHSDVLTDLKLICIQAMTFKKGGQQNCTLTLGVP
jgi:hypothetical protein